mmetsp:Transcript_125105/g.198193  ORF Transcript_125105/g.198193 Transcript_125105/m.198193 type:complete len:97 (+) Transcript_125105:495-785(+)
MLEFVTRGSCASTHASSHQSSSPYLMCFSVHEDPPRNEPDAMMLSVSDDLMYFCSLRLVTLASVRTSRQAYKVKHENHILPKEEWGGNVNDGKFEP